MFTTSRSRLGDLTRVGWVRACTAWGPGALAIAVGLLGRATAEEESVVTGLSRQVRVRPTRP